MPKVDVYDIKGKKVSDVELAENVFGIEPNEAIVHSVLVNYLANQRQGTQSTKTRAEVRGGGKKPWRQKGTGRARQGSIRAPQWVKGGIALGPKPRSYKYTVNKKERRLAVKSMLSMKVLEQSLVVVDKLAFDEIKTKNMVNALTNLKVTGKTFKASGGCVKLTKNGKSIQFLFEAVRREEDWQKKLVDKMRLYKDFYENFVPMDSGFQTMPQLIFICEDEKHAVETFKEIVKNNLEIEQIKLYFTTDLKQNSNTLENTLIEFKLDPNTNKYKVENVELKLLGM